MSDLATTLMDATIPQLGELGSKLADGFLGGMEEILHAAPEAARRKVVDLVKEGFEFKAKALAAKDLETARDYGDAVDRIQRRVKTVLIAESIVAQESTAALVSDLFGQALSGLGTVAKGLISALASGIASGAVKGLVGDGGDGFDPSSIFPFS